MGLEHLFQMWDFQAPLTWEMRGGGKGWDTASGTMDLRPCWIQKLAWNPEAYASQLGCKSDLNPADMQGHGVPEVVTVEQSV